MLPDPLGAIAEDHDRSQFGWRAIPRMPLDNVQSSAARRLGAQPWSKRRCRFTRGNVTGLLQLPALPATDHAELDLAPVALDEGAVQMPIAIADHHAISLDNQHAGRGIMLLCRRLVHLLDVGHRAALLAFQFRAEAFGLRPQRLTAHRDAGQFLQ